MPSYYRVWCRFEPDHVYEITGRKGQWRVLHCFQDLLPESKAVYALKDFCGQDSIAIRSSKSYPRGCIIRPHKELNRVLQQRKAQHAIQPVQNV